MDRFSLITKYFFLGILINALISFFTTLTTTLWSCLFSTFDMVTTLFCITAAFYTFSNAHVIRSISSLIVLLIVIYLYKTDFLNILKELRKLTIRPSWKHT